MRFGNIIAALVTLLLGIFMISQAEQMNSGFAGGLAAGVFPHLLGMGLVFLSGVQIFQEFHPRLRESGGIEWPQGRLRTRVLLLIGAMILYLGTLEWLGFTLVNLLFTICLVRLFGAFSWRKTMSVSLVTALFCALVFQKWLDLGLSGGILGI